jgi:hypothetical protein
MCPLRIGSAGAAFDLMKKFPFIDAKKPFNPARPAVLCRKRSQAGDGANEIAAKPARTEALTAYGLK